MAYLVRHLPALQQLNAFTFIVRRLEECAANPGVSPSELLTWSSELLVDGKNTISPKRRA